MRDEPYSRDQLLRLIAPSTIAVIGATERAGAFGSRVLMNLAGFDGPVWPVNARYAVVHGRPCFPNLAALPGVPDCVFVALPREAAEPVIAECAGAGVGGVILVASGYTETGKPGRAEQQARLLALAQDATMRLVGPNTIGLVNYVTGAGLTFSAMPERRPLAPHAIGIVSQSGSLGFALAQVMERGASVSHVLTSGNSADVDMADYVAYLAADPACRAIACLFEGMAHPLRMIRAARIAAAAGKPLVIYKMATGEAGAAAAVSHTGSLAGSHEIYRAGFTAAGAVVVDKLEALVEAACFLAKAPAAPAAPGVAVIATSGGATIMAADKAELHGVPLPQPGPAADAVLRAHVPEFGSPRNPCDVTAQVITDPAALLACTDALLQDGAFGALVTSHGYAYASATSRLPVFSEAAARAGKIVCNVWAPEWLGGPGAPESEADPHIALFHSMDRCFATLAAWRNRATILARPRRATRLTDPARAAEARRLLAGPGVRTMTESQSKRILALYGIPVVEERLVQTAQEAAGAAGALGYPVVLKLESADIPHKTEVGAVRLGLPDAGAVRQAAADLLRIGPALGARESALSVQRMVARGTEMLVGGRVDPQFGPLVVAGPGGVFVELLRDTALALAPIGVEEASALLSSLRSAALLRGFRGAPAVDVAHLAEIVCRVSELVSDLRDVIEEIDINPVLCTGPEVIAADALVVRREPA